MSKLTKRFVKSITPHPKKVLMFWDEELKGFIWGFCTSQWSSDLLHSISESRTALETYTQASTTQRYAHLHDTPLREVTGLFGKQLREMTTKP